MNYFYFVTDATGTCRLGYLVEESEEKAIILLKKAKVQRIFFVQHVEHLPSRSHIMTFAFEGLDFQHKNIHGTVEAQNWNEAAHILQSSGRITLHALKEGQHISLEEREEVIKNTKHKLSPKQEEAHVKETDKLEEEHSQHRSTLLIQRFQELLQDIKHIFEDLKKDHSFHDNVVEIETSMNILLEKESFSHQELFDYTGYLLRELSFFEETLDPSMLKDSVKEQITRIVEFLASVEEQMKAMHRNDSKTQVGDIPRHQEKTSILFNDLQESFLHYKERKDTYTQKEQDFTAERNAQLEKQKKVIQLSGTSILLEEIPHVTGVLAGLYSAGLLFALWTFVYNIHITLFSFPLSDVAQHLYRQGIQQKLVVSFILVHIAAFIGKKFQSQKQVIILSSAICFLLIIILFSLF